MRVATIAICLLNFGIISEVNAHCSHNKIYGGAGVGFNSVPGFDDSAGYQLFGGYCLDVHFSNPNARTQVEVGYWDSGDLERNGSTTTTTTTRRRGNDEGGSTTRTTTGSFQDGRSLSGVWVSGVGEYKLSGFTHLLGRIGVDLGDDNGVIGGFGVGLNFSKWAQFRGEYVVRNESESVQISWLSEFK